MKVCPVCRERYEDDQTVCPRDGEPLTPEIAAAVKNDSRESPTEQDAPPPRPETPPASAFNPWRVILPAIALLFVAFSAFYMAQRRAAVNEAPPSTLTSDPQSRPVEPLAPPTGDAERDVQPRPAAMTTITPPAASTPGADAAAGGASSIPLDLDSYPSGSPQTIPTATVTSPTAAAPSPAPTNSAPTPRPTTGQTSPPPAATKPTPNPAAVSKPTPQTQN